MIKDDEAYCQPCLSPVWDTALVGACAARGRRRRARAADAGEPRMAQAAASARHRRRLGVDAARRPAGRLGLPIRQPPLSRSRRHRRRGHGHGPRAAASRASALTDFGDAIDRGANGSSACRARTAAGRAFDADNEYDYLNQIPFSDHGALLDPPTADVTARCVSMLAQLGDSAGDDDALDKRHRLSAAHAGEGRQLVRPLGHELRLWHMVRAVRAQCRARRSVGRRRVRKAVDWLLSIQNEDGGWGEDGDSYRLDYKGYEPPRARPRRRRGRCSG